MSAPNRPDPTIEDQMAQLTAEGPARCTVFAVSNMPDLTPNGVLVADIEPVRLEDTRTLGADVHQMVERFTIAGCDPDVDGLLFCWRHDGAIPAVSLVLVGRDGDAKERQWMGHPMGLRAHDGIVTDGVWCLVASCATATAFRFATIGTGQ